MMGKSHLFMGACALAGAAGMHGLIRACNAPGFLSRADAWISGALLPGGAGVTALAAGAGCFLLGNLLPDVDSPASLLGRHAHVPVEHHTITHTAWAVAALCALGWFADPLFLWAGLGYLLHLLADACGACGVAWFYPLTGYRKYPGGAKVKAGAHYVRLYHDGQFSEKVFCGTVSFLMLAPAVWYGVLWFTVP